MKTSPAWSTCDDVDVEIDKNDNNDNYGNSENNDNDG